MALSQCCRCGEWGHSAEACPHIPGERIINPEACIHFQNTPLRDALELRQPGDGHGPFHSLVAGLRLFDVETAGPALGVELANWLRRHAKGTVAGNTFEEWVADETSLGP